MSQACLFTDFLSALGVRYTDDYSRRRFSTMTFQSLFGLSKLLQDYGVASEAYQLADKADDIRSVSTPFLASMAGDFVIVNSVDDSGVEYTCEGVTKHAGIDDFCRLWTGYVLLAFPDDDAIEPDFRKHRFLDVAGRVKLLLLKVLSVALLVYATVEARLFTHVSTALLLLITLAGLYVTWHLFLKSLNFHSRAADGLCGIIDRTGCNTVLKTDAAKFFGLFSWSEVGLAYFSVTLVGLLVFPDSIASLALINAICCPFSIWSVWYQKFRAKAWCTMCLITQACLWLSLACYAFGSHFTEAFPLQPSFFVLGVSYAVVLLALNALSPYLTRDENQA